jgi:hypothetical protein
MNADNVSHAVTGFSLVNLAPLGNFTICATSFCRSSSRSVQILDPIENAGPTEFTASAQMRVVSCPDATHP